MSQTRLIITHPGSAHKDDLLACCVLLHFHKVPIERRDPTPEDLADPTVKVIDVGHEHEPTRGNFDHHQFPRDHEPICALSLVLKDLGLYDDAKKFCDWMEPAEWFDTRGANDTAKWLGVERQVIGQLNSPIDVTMLRRFAREERLTPDKPLWQIMEMIGEDLVMFLRDLRSRLGFVEQHARFLTLHSDAGEFEVLYMPRTNPMPVEPSAGLGRYIEEVGKEGSVIGMIYPDRRGPGFGISRFNDDRRLDFSGLATEHEDVHFAHARGFVAKTSATDLERLKELVIAARNATM